jgi:CRISPR-associated protein Cmr5
MSAAKSLDLQRAEHALQAVENLQDKNIDHYVSYVQALPANILQNGLGQSMATLLAASKDKQDDDPHHRLYKQIQSWLCRKQVDAPYSSQSKLIQAITEGNEQAYLHAHAEALAYLVWLKKFAVAFLSKPDHGEAR